MPTIQKQKLYHTEEAAHRILDVTYISLSLTHALLPSRIGKLPAMSSKDYAVKLGESEALC